jgi:ABC-type polysaccharide/polyol phosphate transport system ATPase subunit
MAGLAMALRSTDALSAPTQAKASAQEPVIVLKSASKDVVEGANHRYPAFRNLSLTIGRGERIGVFSLNAAESRTLIACLSGVEPLDAGRLEQHASVSWPLGSNDAFSGKLSGYINARFAAEVYSSSGRIEDDLVLIRDLAGIDDDLFHKPLSEWPGQAKDSLKLALSLAFEFDVTMVGRVGNWDHRAIHPRAVRLRRLFEERIAGRTLVIAGNGQQALALDYCDQGLALLEGDIVYRGDPEVCLELINEVANRKKQERRARVKARISSLLEAEREEGVDDAADEANGPESA